MTIIDLNNNLMRCFNFTIDDINQDNFFDILRQKESYVKIISKFSQKIRLIFFIKYKKEIDHRENYIFDDIDPKKLFDYSNYDHF
jgi:hypothetical protein